jgi:hypothetical protein
MLQLIFLLLLLLVHAKMALEPLKTCRSCTQTHIILLQAPYQKTPPGTRSTAPFPLTLLPIQFSGASITMRVSRRRLVTSLWVLALAPPLYLLYSINPAMHIPLSGANSFYLMLLYGFVLQTTRRILILVKTIDIGVVVNSALVPSRQT